MNPIFWTILYVIATILCFYKKICLEPKGERLDCLKLHLLWRMRQRVICVDKITSLLFLSGEFFCDICDTEDSA
jgi:hypothetical protein